MLEANAVERVGKLDVDAEIVGIELELVAGLERCVFRDSQRQRRDRAIEGELPVSIGVGPHVKAYRSARVFSLNCLGHSRHVFLQTAAWDSKAVPRRFDDILAA